MIIFGQGAIRCHPYLLQEVELLTDTENPNRLPLLGKLLFSHIAYFFKQMIKTFWHGLTGGLCIHSPISGKTARFYRQLTRMSVALAFLSDVSLLVLGGSLKRRESISARLGDILSQLYLASTVLKYYHDHEQAPGEIAYVTWSVEMALYHMQVAINELCDNFPRAFLGWFLQKWIFPWGNAYRKPSDALSHEIVSMMAKPSAFRQRLTQGCYEGSKETDPLHRLECALREMILLEPILKKYHTVLRNNRLSHLSLSEQLSQAVAAGVLSKDEAEHLKTFEQLRREVIKVDEFSFDFGLVVTP